MKALIIGIALIFSEYAFAYDAVKIFTPAGRAFAQAMDGIKETADLYKQDLDKIDVEKGQYFITCRGLEKPKDVENCYAATMALYQHLLDEFHRGESLIESVRGLWGYE